MLTGRPSWLGAGPTLEELKKARLDARGIHCLNPE